MKRATKRGLKSSLKTVKARQVSVTAYHDRSSRCCGRGGDGGGCGGLPPQPSLPIFEPIMVPKVQNPCQNGAKGLSGFKIPPSNKAKGL